MPLRLGTLISASRILLFVVSLLALATTALFVFAGPSVDAWFAAIPERSTRRLDTRLADARSRITPITESDAPTDQGRSEAILILTSLADDLSDSKKGDRSFPARRECLTLLATLHAETGDWESSAQCASDLLLADERDLIAARLAANARARIPASADEGLGELRALHRKFRTLMPVADALASELLRREMVAEAFPVILSAYEEVDPRARIPWRIYFDLGEGFDVSVEATPSFSANGSLRIGIDLLAGTRAVRVDPPPGCSLRLSTPVLATLNDVAKRTLPFNALSLRLHHMTQEADGSIVTTGGDDPYAHLTLPTTMEIKTKVPIEILADTARPRSGFIAEILETGKGAALERELSITPLHRNSLRRLLDLRRRAAIGDSWCLSTGDGLGTDVGQQHFAWATPTSNTHDADPYALPFDLTIPLGDPSPDPTCSLTIPAIHGVGYQLQELKWRLASGDAKAVTLSPSNDLEPETDGTLRVTGPSPTMIGSPPPDATALELSGWIR